MQIQLPEDFTEQHEEAVISYLQDTLRGRDAWRRAYEAFDLLDQALVITSSERHSFRALYLAWVDRVLADDYLQDLLALKDVSQESPALWARYARRVVTLWQERDLRGKSGSRLLLSYLLYWWGAFARGYAFEVEIFRDLKQSGIDFQAHDLTSRQARYSPSDLIVHGMAGDIKTSTYFVQVAAPFRHDFYIVRLFISGRTYTLATMLQPPAWEEINGDTVEGSLQTVVTQFPQPVRIQAGGYELVALEYTVWKERILRLQREAE